MGEVLKVADRGCGGCESCEMEMKMKRSESFILVHEPNPGGHDGAGNKMQAMCQKDTSTVRGCWVSFVRSPFYTFLHSFCTTSRHGVLGRLSAHKVLLENFKSRDNLEDLGVDGIILLKRIFKKLYVRMWAAFSSFMIRSEVTGVQRSASCDNKKTGRSRKSARQYSISENIQCFFFKFYVGNGFVIYVVRIIKVCFYRSIIIYILTYTKLRCIFDVSFKQDCPLM
jgi:hypothetical protein